MADLPYGRHSIDQSDIDAVVAALRADFLTQGPTVGQFEAAVAELVGARHGVAVNSATSALHLACLALELRPGDVAWTSPITFAATANCVFYCGGRVEYIDINRDSFNVDPSLLEERLRKAASANQLPKVFLPVHLGGAPCDMDVIIEVCRNYGVRVVQDASHALGARIGPDSVLAPRFGDVAVTSFHPVKMITTAEGGMAITSDEECARRIARLRSHGITRAVSEMSVRSDDPWYYEQLELGFNYRMPDLFAALGLSQLRRLEYFVQRRNEIAEQYRQLLDPQCYQLQRVAQGTRSSYHLVIAVPNYEVLRTSQREVFERLRMRGVRANLHYIPVYRHPFHRARLVREPDCPNAEWYYARAITLPCYPAMTNDDVKSVVDALQTPVGHQTIF